MRHTEVFKRGSARAPTRSAANKFFFSDLTYSKHRAYFKTSEYKI